MLEFIISRDWFISWGLKLPMSFYKSCEKTSDIWRQYVSRAPLFFFEETVNNFKTAEKFPSWQMNYQTKAPNFGYSNFHFFDQFNVFYAHYWSISKGICFHANNCSWRQMIPWAELFWCSEKLIQSFIFLDSLTHFKSGFLIHKLQIVGEFLKIFLR